MNRNEIDKHRAYIKEQIDRFKNRGISQKQLREELLARYNIKVSDATISSIAKDKNVGPIILKVVKGIKQLVEDNYSGGSSSSISKHEQYIVFLDQRAESVRTRLEDCAETKTFVQRFIDLHEKHLTCIRKGFMINAHDIRNQIYQLSREMKIEQEADSSSTSFFDRLGEGFYLDNRPGELFLLYFGCDNDDSISSLLAVDTSLNELIKISTT